MNDKRKYAISLAVLSTLLFAVNYPFLDKVLGESLSTNEYGVAERVIDGDTVVINGTSVRLLGVNSPERKELYYSEAKIFLEELVLNKTLRIESGKDKYDRYNRRLAYLHIDDKNVNLELVRNGFANSYFPSGKDIYYNKFKNAWEECIKDNKNLCEKSSNKCADCIKLETFDYKYQEVIFRNECSFDCNLNEWKIKDEGRKNFVFQDFTLRERKDLTLKVGEGESTDSVLYWTGEEYVWTKTGDSLFLRDNQGKLVLWESY